MDQSDHADVCNQKLCTDGESCSTKQVQPSPDSPTKKCLNGDYSGAACNSLVVQPAKNGAEEKPSIDSEATSAAMSSSGHDDIKLSLFMPVSADDCKISANPSDQSIAIKISGEDSGIGMNDMEIEDIFAVAGAENPAVCAGTSPVSGEAVDCVIDSITSAPVCGAGEESSGAVSSGTLDSKMDDQSNFCSNPDDDDVTTTYNELLEKVAKSNSDDDKPADLTVSEGDDSDLPELVDDPSPNINFSGSRIEPEDVSEGILGSDARTRRMRARRHRMGRPQGRDGEGADVEAEAERMEDTDDDDDFLRQIRDEDDSSDEDPTADEQAAQDYVLPPSSWHSCRAVMQREYGGSPRLPFMEQFRRSFTGSMYVVERFELMAKLDDHEGCVNCLNFNSSGTRLLTGSDDLDIVMWDWANEAVVTKFESGHRANVFQAKYMALEGDCHVVSCARDGQIRVAELSTSGECKGTRKLAQHRGAAHKLTLVEDSPHVFLCAGEDGVVFEIDLRDPAPNKILLCRKSAELSSKLPLYSIHNSPACPHQFVVSGKDQFVRIYDRRSLGDHTQYAPPLKRYCPDHLKEIKSQWGPNVTCVVYNYNGSEVLASYNDEDIFSFDTSHSDGADFIHRYTGHRNNATVKGVNWYGPKSEFVISGSDCGNVYFWEKNSEIIVQFMAGDEGGVINCLEPHPQMPILATSGLDSDAKIWIPSSDEPGIQQKIPQLNKLKRQNKKRREKSSESGDYDSIDSEMVWFMLSQLRRVANRRREGGTDAEQDGSPGSDSDLDSNPEVHQEQDEGEESGGVGCRTS